MARLKNNAAQGQLLKKAPLPKMPEGYYSGDKPNPNLRQFVEEHLKEHPYDPATDKYNVPPFDKPIETTKATAIYNMHTYWSKKPHDAIRQYIRHYTKPGDLVLDPFCGSGGTALAALMEGRKVIAIDRSPAATFITKNYWNSGDTILISGIPGTPYLFRRDAPPASTEGSDQWGTHSPLSPSGRDQKGSAEIPGRLRRNLAAGTRCPVATRARAGIAYLWVEGLGHAGRPRAAVLGVRPQAAYQAVARGRAARAEWDRLLGD